MEVTQINTDMEYTRFKDYLTDRQLREADEMIKVDPATKMAQKKAGEAVAKTLQQTNVDLSSAKNDPVTKNRFMGKALAKASRQPGGGGVDLTTIAKKINPDMKV